VGGRFEITGLFLAGGRQALLGLSGFLRLCSGQAETRTHTSFQGTGSLQIRDMVVTSEKTCGA
jgi:hypothetical protein